VFDLVCANVVRRLQSHTICGMC